MSRVNQKITPYAILVFTLGSLFCAYTFVVQVIPSTIATQLRTDFAASMSQLGLLSSSFYWLYAGLMIPAGFILDRYGARKILAIATTTCGLGTLIFALAPNINTAIIGRTLMGASATFSFIGTIYLIIRWLPPATLAMFAGLIQMIDSIGAISGGSVMAKIMQAYPWRPIVIIIGTIGIFLGFIIWILVRNKPANTPNDQTRLKTKLTKSLKVVLRNKQAWYVAIYAFAIWGPTLAFTALWGIPFFKVDLHFSNFQAANAAAITWIAIAIGSPLIGWLSNKIKRSRILLTTSALIGFFSMFLIVYYPHLSSLDAYTLLFLIGIAASTQTLTFAVVRDNNHFQTCGLANGFNNMWVVLGGIILQPIIGFLLDLNWQGATQAGIHVYNLHAYHIALLILPIAYLFAAFISAFYIKETKCQPIEQSALSTMAQSPQESCRGGPPWPPATGSRDQVAD